MACLVLSELCPGFDNGAGVNRGGEASGPKMARIKKTRAWAGQKKRTKGVMNLQLNLHKKRVSRCAFIHARLLVFLIYKLLILLIMLIKDQDQGERLMLFRFHPLSVPASTLAIPECT
jgi:hypothetical protein